MSGRSGLTRLVAVAAVALCPVVATACGESDEDKVRAVLDLVASTDPEACEQMTRELLDLMYEGSEKRCREKAKADNQTQVFKVASVSVRDNQATAKAKSKQGSGTMRLVKQDGEWKVRDFGMQPVQQVVGKPIIKEGLNPRETVRAYFSSIRDEDGARFCGLISTRRAFDLLEPGDHRNIRGQCVVAEFNWDRAKKEIRGMKVRGVQGGGDEVRVRLSNRVELLLVQEDRRWVVDGVDEPSR
jgi:hypothetical protein